MGTILDWVSVLVFGGLLCGLLGWYSMVPTESLQELKPVWKVANVVYWMTAGLLLGIVGTFHWQQAVHRPLVFVSGPVILALLILGYLLRKQRKSTRVSR